MKRRRTKRPARFLPYIQAGGIVAAVVVIVSGVTFAALQSQQAKLTGNTIQTATANLQVSTDGSTFSSSQAGFTFGAIVPGGQAAPSDGYPIFLKNAGGTPLALRFAVSSTPGNTENVDLTKVHILLVPMAGGSIQNFTLQSLIATSTTGGQPLTIPLQLLPNATTGYKFEISMEGDAVNGPGATINNLDFSFSGIAVS